MRRALAVLAGLPVVVLACSGEDDPARQGSSRDTPMTSEAAARPAAPEPDVCALPSGGYAEACNACLAESCCEAVEACKADATCNTQLGCVVGCQGAEDPTLCSQACLEPGGVHAGYVAYDDCSFGMCLSTCWM